MCETCGCTVPKDAGVREIEVHEKILIRNDRQAAENREHLDEHGLLMVNLMSSPGAGKTTLLERTIDALAGAIRIGVIEGDLETERDADRIRAKGVPALQITTGSACHLDAAMVHRALHDLPLHDLDVIFVENVGNLVCPAAFDLGAHHNVVLLSVPEGEDKPAKYPVMFRKADTLLISKSDLLPYLPFRVDEAVCEARRVRPDIRVIELSALTGEGVGAWIDFLRAAVSRNKTRRDVLANPHAHTHR